MRTASVLSDDQSSAGIRLQTSSQDHSKEELPQQEEPAEPVERTLLRLLMDVGAEKF